MIDDILQNLGLSGFAPIFKEQRVDADRFEKLYSRGCKDVLAEDLQIHASFLDRIHAEIERTNAKLTPQSKSNLMKFQGSYGRNNRVARLLEQNTRPSPLTAKTNSALSSGLGNSSKPAQKHQVADVRVQDFTQPALEAKHE